MEINGFDFQPAGYAYLLKKHSLAGMPNWHRSSVSTTGTHYSKSHDSFVDEVFRTQYWPGENVGDHLQNRGKSPRHRIVNNLLGPKAFCPVVRRTEKLSKLDSSNLRKRYEDIVTAYPPELLRRVLPAIALTRISEE